MKASLLLGLMLFTSCGQQLALHKDTKQHADPRPVLTTSPIFIKYINEFEYYYGHTIGDIPVNFALMKESNYAAVCNEWDSGERSIEVSQTHWNGLSEEQRQELLFHELGHCELNLDHNEDYELDNCPSSIMNPSVFGNYGIETCYTPKFDYYINQLFGR